MWGEWLGCTMKGRKRDAHELDKNYKGNNFTFPYSEISALSTLATITAQRHLFLK